jgi:serine/threonine protein kinase
MGEWPESGLLPGGYLFVTKRPRIFCSKLEARLAEEFHPAIDLLMQMLEWNPKNRITAKDAIKNPWITQCEEWKSTRFDKIMLLESHQTNVVGYSTPIH